MLIIITNVAVYIGLHLLLFIWTIICCKKADEKKKKRIKSERSSDITKTGNLDKSSTVPCDEPKTAIQPVRITKTRTNGSSNVRISLINIQLIYKMFQDKDDDKDKESNNSDCKSKLKTKSAMPPPASGPINSKERTDKKITSKERTEIKIIASKEKIDKSKKNIPMTSTKITTDRENKIAKGLVVRRQSDYPEMNENISDYDVENQIGGEKSEKNTKSKKSVSFLVWI